ncbi:IS4 family transposase [Neptunicella sp. SCSIO 80796]|uniref:IS4 family transposase n=1 Tax=Neptunicella plasticusilytica TaxID=3117012 RepID=UPI003A4DBE78
MPVGCQPIIVTDAGYKSPWFREVKALGWDIVGRIRKPHFYSVDRGTTWQCISQLYQMATPRAKRFDNAQLVRYKPFDCTLVLVKQRNKGRHANNPDGSPKHSGLSLKHAQSAKDPWLLATSLPKHRNLAKQVVAIYRQHMQIEEGFRDMKSTRFGLGFEQNNTVKSARLTILVLLTTLASMIAILLGITLTVANKHRRFQANTVTKQVLSFHTLGLRALVAKTRFTQSQWRRALKWFDENAEIA